VPYKFSARSLKNLQGVHPDLLKICHRALELSPIDFLITEGVRTVERQKQLFAAGASKTMNSRHITGHAVDVAALLSGKPRWDSSLYYQIAGAFQSAAKEKGIPTRWGGAWERLDTTDSEPYVMVLDYADRCRKDKRKPFIDSAHFELPSGVYQ
jgi:peptidoglycan L-alanyl-D-glutamate endopeptidase CwlK